MEIELKDVVEALKGRVGQDAATLAMQDIVINRQARTIEQLQIELTQLRSDALSTPPPMPAPAAEL